MSKNLSTTVLVVGSGPIGLWLAYELRRAGLDVLVIDTLLSREARCPYSKALSMSAGTLETFESRGIAKCFLASGMPLPRTHFGGLPTLLELNYEVLGVQHCHNLVIPQSRTETTLLDRCDEVGVRFAWGMEFEDLKQDLEGVTATAREVHDTKISGIVQINASWVVGCDGTHSKVRKAAGIPFEGTPSNLTGMLADIQLTTKPQQIPLIAEGPGSGSMLAPIGDGLHFRFVGMADQNIHKLASKEVTLDQIQECMRDAFGSDFGAHSPLWLSRYGNAARAATSFREGRVFLAGDAAHQFFPAGGQGMNLGIQDATSLAWRLVMVSSGSVSGEASERILSTYSLERRAAAEFIVENVQAQTAIISANTPQMIAVRSLVSEALQAPELNATWARRVCGFDEPNEPYRLSVVKGEPKSVFNVLEDPMLGQRVTHLKCGNQGVKYVNVGGANKFVLLLLGNGREEIEKVEIIERARNHKDVEVSDIIVNSRESMWKDGSASQTRYANHLDCERQYACLKQEEFLFPLSSVGGLAFESMKV